MKIELKYPDSSEHALTEQTQYLEGVLYADKSFRMDMDGSRNVSDEIDRYGTCTKAFWRGVIESAGRLNEYPVRDYSYPRVELEGSYHFLLKFVDFLKEEMDREGNGMAWSDVDAKLRFQASGNLIRITGARAQDAVRVLYLGAEVSQESCRERADKILAWSPKR